MNTAIIFYGQPRFAKECAPLIKERLIEPNNADVFMHFWLPTEGYEYKYSSNEYDPNWKNLQIDSDIEQWLIDFYKPKAYLAEKPKDFYLPVEFGNSIEKYFGGVKHLSEPELEKWKRIHIRNSLSMWYSILQAQILCGNPLRYDRIIRCRFDCYPNRSILMSDFSNNKNDIFYENLNQPDSMISDWLVFGESRTMSILNSIYLRWYEYVFENLISHNAWCNELLQRTCIDQEFFSVRAHPINMGLVLKRM